MRSTFGKIWRNVFLSCFCIVLEEVVRLLIHEYSDDVFFYSTSSWVWMPLYYRLFNICFYLFCLILVTWQASVEKKLKTLNPLSKQRKNKFEFSQLLPSWKNVKILSLAFFNIKSTCPTKPNLVHFQHAVCRIANSDTHNIKSGSLIDRTYD